jgi:hypothetical protein
VCHFMIGAAIVGEREKEEGKKIKVREKRG